MKKKGFTLVELLVVIAIIALLMGILMPALSKVRQIAYRIICGANLTGIGKSMLVYSQDNDEWFPVGGARGARWNLAGGNWLANNRDVAYNTTNTTPYGTIAASFYLLVKYTDTQPKLFVCKGEEGAKVFSPADAGATSAADAQRELTSFWNFGDDNGSNVKANVCYSYSYQLPFIVNGMQAGTTARYNITAASLSGSPVASDKNPYYDRNANNYRDGLASSGLRAPTWIGPDDNGRFEDLDKTANSASHQRDGQNVLFQDTHVEFAQHPNVGINRDNIFKSWNITTLGAKNMKAVEFGANNTGMIANPPPAATNVPLQQPKAKEDCLLVNEQNI